jgi:hypothetical protein
LVASDEAVYITGGGERNITNFLGRLPDPLSQPDYSGAYMDPTIYLYREFMHDATASPGFTLNLVGTYTTLEYKLAKVWDATATGGTVWINALAAYNFAQWNNGNPLGGTGGQTAPGHYTFGSNNIINTSNTLYVRIGMTAGQRVTTLNVVFD